MSSQAPFSQGNATPWKEAICSQTIRLTLFSSRLDLKEGHVFVSLRTQGATLSKFRAASQGRSESCHKVLKDVTGKIRLPEQGCNRYFHLHGHGLKAGGMLSILLVSPGKQGAVHPCTRVWATHLPLEPVRTAPGWCTGATWCAGFHGTGPSGNPRVPDPGWKMKEKLISDLRRKETHPLRHGRIGTSVKF